jgi:prevent-host-death family protein
MTATEFKAKCLEILDQLSAREIETLTITKRGKPVAVLSAPDTEADSLRRLHGSMRGSVIVPDGFDLTAPVLDEALDADNGILHR